MKKKINYGRAIVALSAFVSSSAYANYDAVPGEFVVQLKPGSFFTLSAGQRLDEQTYLVKSTSAAELSKNPAVAKVEPNYIYHSLGLDWSLENSGQVNCEGQKGMQGIDVKARSAWGITSGSSSVVVAVIDTGVDVNNPRLRDKILVNEAEEKGQAGVDDDRNGFVDDVYGFDFTANRGLITDDNGHGTFCAGSIAASEGSGLVAGLAPGVKILPVKFLSAEGAGTLANAVKAIDYAVARGAKVLSNSWGGGTRSDVLEDSIKAAKEKGVLFVAAAGNSGSDNDTYPTYPASYALGNVLSVNAVDNQGKIPEFSNFGRNVHVAAPGVSLMGLSIDGGGKCSSGTSMSTPLVAATAALMLSKRPTLSAEEIKARIIETATPLPGLKSANASGAIVNAYQALLGL